MKHSTKPLLIAKFGGTSIASQRKMRRAADVIHDLKHDHEVIVVASAMGKRTDRLMALAQTIHPDAPLREVDRLLSTGELESCPLLTMALCRIGVNAQSLSGAEAGIVTSSDHGAAVISYLEGEGLKRVQVLLQSGITPVIAGFQGRSEDGNVTTLGRGGSDITAVMLGHAFKADEVRIYTDVDGVMSADPRMIKDAQVKPSLTTLDMRTMADAGAQVLHPRAASLTERQKLRVRIQPVNKDAKGTVLVSDVLGEPQPGRATAVVSDMSHVLLTAKDLAHHPTTNHVLLDALACIDVTPTMFECQGHANSDLATATFLIKRDDERKAMSILNEMAAQEPGKLGTPAFQTEHSVATVTVVGDMTNGGGQALRTATSALASEHVLPRLMTSTHRQLTIVVDDAIVNRVVTALHQAFGLSERESDKQSRLVLTSGSRA